MELYGSYTLPSYAGVGLQENEVATMQVSVNGEPDPNKGDFSATINWGDGGSSTGDFVYMGSSGTASTYLIKGSHVYQNAGTSIPVTVTATGPGGTTATMNPNDLDYADIAAMPSGIPGKQPPATSNGAAPENVQIAVYGSYTLESYVGVGFQENEVATMQVSVNGQADGNLSDFHALINWGDSASWDQGDLVFQGSSGTASTYLIKGSHVYQNAYSDLPIVIYVTGPDGTSDTLQPNDLDYADVVPMPSGIAGTQPPATSNGAAPENVQIAVYGSYTLNSYVGVGFQNEELGTIQVSVNGQSDPSPGDFHAEINWGDTASWDPGEITYQGSSGTSSTFLIKGSHVYQKPGTEIPIVVYVTGPDGTSADLPTNDLDYADVAPNPNGITIGNLTPAQWDVNEAGYDGTIPVSGGTGTYTDLVVTGLPSGLRAEMSGSTITITGTPTESGTFDDIAVALEDSQEDEGDGTEDLTIDESQPTPTILIAINNTVSTNDNITLYNPPGSAQPFTQTIPARITNLGSEAATFQLTVDQAGSGNVTLSQTSLDLASGASAEITITPTADSSAVNDVHIVAVDDDGAQLAEDDMTVVRVTLPNTISNADTPAAMLAAGAYRIPPRVNTPENIQVTPNLSGSGQSVTLTVTGQSATNGTVTIGGGATQTITATGNVQLSSPSGNTQTAPRSAAQLHLALQVRGENTTQSANGFSVAAIPIYLYDVLQASLVGTVRGIQVANVWRSDSGVIGDLNQVTVQEQVQSVTANGIFQGRPFVASPPRAGTTGTPQFPNLGITLDNHSFPLSFITAAHYTGIRQALQTTDFADNRSGPAGPITVPMANSGDVITQTVYTVTSGTGKKRTVTVMVRTTETGAATSANGIASGPATTYQSAAGPPGPISVTQVAVVLPNQPSSKHSKSA